MRQTLSSGGDRSDLHFGEILAVPHLALEALAATEFEHDQLLATTVPYDFGFDLSALDERLADIGTIAQHREHLVKHHALASLAREGCDAQDVTLGYAELLPAAAKDC